MDTIRVIDVGPLFRPSQDVFDLSSFHLSAFIISLPEEELVGTGSALHPIEALRVLVRAGGARDSQSICAVGADCG